MLKHGKIKTVKGLAFTLSKSKTFIGRGGGGDSGQCDQIGLFIRLWASFLSL